MSEFTAAISKNRDTRQDNSCHDAAAGVLARNMEITSKSAGLTKRAAARLAIARAIQSGALRPGDKLPPEVKLTAILGVSLGTVQAALRQLQLVGAIVRRRGDGSRVASAEPIANSVWHFRFVSKSDGTPLHIADQKVRIDTTAETGEWSRYIGRRPAYIRIRRCVVLYDGALAGAEMYLDAALAPGLPDVAANELDMVNIRPYLEEQFGIVTAGATHVAKTVKLDERTAELFGLSTTPDYFEIHAKAFSDENRPVYFQRIFISTDVCALTF